MQLAGPSWEELLQEIVTQVIGAICLRFGHDGPGSGLQVVERVLSATVETLSPCPPRIEACRHGCLELKLTDAGQLTATGNTASPTARILIMHIVVKQWNSVACQLLHGCDGRHVSMDQ